MWDLIMRSLSLVLSEPFMPASSDFLEKPKSPRCSLTSEPHCPEMLTCRLPLRLCAFNLKTFMLVGDPTKPALPTAGENWWCFFGVPVVRIVVFGGSYWGPCILGKCQKMLRTGAHRISDFSDRVGSIVILVHSP